MLDNIFLVTYATIIITKWKILLVMNKIFLAANDNLGQPGENYCL